MHLNLSKLESKDSNYEDKCYEVVKNSEYYIKMCEFFPSFSKEFESLFIMVLKDFDLGPLDFMLNTMKEIANGSVAKDKGEMAIGEHLAQKFIKSVDPDKIFKKVKKSKK